jgi:hypothetical protein
MTVIAMTHDVGPLGSRIAADLASRLGLDHVVYTLTEPGDASSDYARKLLVQAFATVTLPAQPDTAGQRHARPMTEVDIIERAMLGRVILEGHGAHELLAKVPHVLSVRIYPVQQARRSEVGPKAVPRTQIPPAGSRRPATALVTVRLLGSDRRERRIQIASLSARRRDIPHSLEHLVRMVHRLDTTATIASRLALEDLCLDAQAKAAARFGYAALEI